jgi:hypothetical protein
VTLLDLMDAIQVHATAAAVAAGGATRYDVAVGFPVSKGTCVRIFYGGERETARFNGDETLNSQLVGQGIVVRGYWPVAVTAVNRQRLIEGEMAVFVKELRTRVLGDFTLGGKAQDALKMHLAATDQVMIANTQYAVVDIEIVVDYDEYSYLP